MKKKLVSICLGTYNQKDYINECLDSISTQTYPNIEVIISDDCSKDETYKKIKLFFLKNKNNFKVKIFKQRTNIGISKNFNFLYKQAKGEYIIFFGGDDIMVNNKIEKQVKILTTNPKVSFAYSNCKRFFNSNKKICFNHFNFFNRYPKSIKNILSDLTIPSPTMMINRKYIDHQPFNERLKYYGDFLLIIKLWKKKNPIYIDETLVFYRKHKNSILLSHKSNNERLLLINLIKKEFKDNSLYQKEIAKYKYIYTYHQILNGRFSILNNLKDFFLFILQMTRSVRGVFRLFIIIIYFIKSIKKN
jgi:glycosyltransferase involved in cell wall biosynthesis